MSESGSATAVPIAIVDPTVFRLHEDGADVAVGSKSPPLFGTFSHVMSPLCLQTLLEFLSPYKRITSRTVSQQFARAARQPSLWSRTIYEHSIVSSSEPLSPFHVDSDSNPTHRFIRPLPPTWLRSSLGSLKLDSLDPGEVLYVLPKFSSIRSLNISIQASMNVAVNDMRMRDALSTLSRLEDLSIECDPHDILLRALFSSYSNALATEDDDTTLANNGVTMYKQTPAIWSYVETLHRIGLRQARSATEPFLVFARTMSRRQWPQLEHLEYGLYAETPASCEDSRRRAAEKLFTAECLPQLAHLSFQGGRYGKLNNNSRDVTGGINLPQLTHLNHSIPIFRSRPTLGFGGLGALAPAVTHGFGAPVGPATTPAPTIGFGNPGSFGASGVFLPTPNIGAPTFDPFSLLPEDNEELDYVPANHQKDELTESDVSVEYSPGLIYLECQHDVNWNSLVRLSRLTYLALSDIKEIPSLQLFESIGHHALPHLAILSLPCERSEPQITQVDKKKVFNLMSQMIALTALHSHRLSYADGLSQIGFQWFVHLYHFPSLERIAFIVARTLGEYRTVPLPLPPGVTLTPDQHRLYPNGGIGLPLPPFGRPFIFISPKPSWLVIDPPPHAAVIDRAKFASFYRRTVEYIDPDKFRLGAREYQHAKNQAETESLTQINEDPSSGQDHFTKTMSDLCMMITLTYLPVLEIARTQSVSHHFHRSVLHSAVWKNTTFRVTSADALPSPAVSALLGGVELSITPLLNQWSSLSSSLVSTFPSLRRLTFLIQPNIGSILDETVTPARGSDSTVGLLHLESLTLRADELVTSNASSINDWSQGRTEEILQDFFEVHGTIAALPLIYNYADSLKRLELTVPFSSNNHEVLATTMIHRVWSALETCNIKWMPIDSQDRVFPMNARLPFEYILTHSNQLLPRLSSLGLELPALGDLSIEKFPIPSLESIFIALASANTLLRLSHSFPCLIAKHFRDQGTFAPPYPSSLTSLSIKNQPVAWNQVAKLSSLTELQLSQVSNPLTPIQLFECIGHHCMPSLATLSIECTTHKYSDAVECTHESERVLKLMSEMTSLTQLHSELVKYNEGQSSRSFCWFAHAYLFPSLKRIEYLLNVGDPNHLLWYHTLLPLPTILEKTSVAADHPLLPTRSQPRFCPVKTESLRMFTKCEYYQSITIQSQYVNTSFEEMRIEYLREEEKAKEESRPYQLPELRDTHVKFTSSIPASLVASSADELSFTVLPKTESSSN